MMEPLIPIILKAEHEPAISARELHRYLSIDTRLVQWLPDVLTYGFAAGVDYDGPQVVAGQVDYFLTLDMAKGIALLQQTPEGNQLREYLAATEREWWHELREQLRQCQGQVQELAEAAAALEYWPVATYARLLGVELTPQQQSVVEKRAGQASRRLKLEVQQVKNPPKPPTRRFHKQVLYQVFIKSL